MREQAIRIARNLQQVIRGKDDVIDLLLVALCSAGHVLIEDVPGVGKTTLAKALAASIQADFRRIQFTPDLLPTDITGGMVYSPGTGEFLFKPGPLFCNILVGDEINRASPRTQSALLEAMNEGQVTLDGKRYPLAAPFIVIATQNPIEFQGTFQLPEAQLDRFLLRIEIGYPEAADEIQILIDQQDNRPFDHLGPVASCADVLELQAAVRRVDVELSVKHYITDLVRATRRDPRLRLGASPRATLGVARAAQAHAFLAGRNLVLPDDVKAILPHVLAHRLILDNGAAYAGQRTVGVVADILTNTPVPV